MDYLDRYRDFDRRERKKIMAEFRVVAQATKEKLEEVVFYCNQINRAVDEPTARIQAIRAQDEPKPPSPELPPGS